MLAFLTDCVSEINNFFVSTSVVWSETSWLVFWEMVYRVSLTRTWLCCLRWVKAMFVTRIFTNWFSDQFWLVLVLVMLHAPTTLCMNLVKCIFFLLSNEWLPVYLLACKPCYFSIRVIYMATKLHTVIYRLASSLYVKLGLHCAILGRVCWIAR